MMFGMGLFGVIFWVAVIALVIWGVNQVSQTRRRQTDEHGDTPLSILKKRYARGEITKEQFEQMKKELNG